MSWLFTSGGQSVGPAVSASVLLIYIQASLVVQRVKHLPKMRKTWVRSLGREDPLEKDMATHCSIPDGQRSLVGYINSPRGHRELDMIYSELISFRMDWLDLLAVQRTLKSLLQHHSSKAPILQRSAFFMVQLSHPLLWWLRR